MDPGIRTAAPQDLELLLPHVRKFWAFERLNVDPQRPRAALARLLAEPAWGSVLLLESAPGAELLGYLVLTFGFSLEHGGRDALIDELYVCDELRGQGLGTRLIDAATELCRELEITRIHLEVDHFNPRAQELYARLGFVGNQRRLLTRKLARP